MAGMTIYDALQTPEGQAYFRSLGDAQKQDFEEKVRQFEKLFGLKEGELMGVYNGQNTLDLQKALGYTNAGDRLLNLGEAIGEVQMPDGSVRKTLSGISQDAALSGNYGKMYTPAYQHQMAGDTGMVAPSQERLQQLMGLSSAWQNGGQPVSIGEVLDSPIYKQMVATGQIDPNQPFGGLGTATEDARQFNVKTIMDAQANAQANPFSYLAKYGNLQQAGALGGMLGGAVRGATGQSIGALASQQPYSNAQLATDLVSGSMGRPMSQAGQSFLTSITGAQPQGAGQQMQAGGGGGFNESTGQFDPNMAWQGMVSALQQSQPHQPQLPSLTGFGTSMQQFNRLNGSGQNALIDYVGTAGGENKQDFLKGLLQGSPQFDRSANARMGF